jgi:DNA-binding transcriptional ArsR family regulator
LETRYATLSNQLTKRIGTGEYRVGHYLPSEKQLASEFGVSRPTVRRALDYVEALGLISRRRGDGTKVLAEKPFTDYRYTTRPVDDLLYGRVPSVLSPARVTLYATMCWRPVSARRRDRAGFISRNIAMILILEKCWFGVMSISIKIQGHRRPHSRL